MDPDVLPFTAHTLLDALSDPAWISDASGRVFHTNRVYQQSFHAVDLFHHPLHQLPVPSERAQLLEQYTRCLHTGQAFNLNFPILVGDQEHLYELQCRPLQEGAHLGWLGILRPSKESHLEALLEHAPVGLGLVDREYRMRILNEKTVQGTPHSREDFQHRSLKELYPATFPLLQQVIDRVWETGETQVLEFESRYPRPGEPLAYWRVHYFPVWGKDGKLLGVGCVNDNIRELKDAEKNVQEQQDFLRQITDAIPAILTVRVLATNEVLLTNDAFARFLGYTREELDALPLSELTFPEDREHFARSVQRIYTLPEGEVLEQEMRMRHKDGSERWMAGRIVIFRRDDAGKPLISINTGMDVTRRVQMERQLRDSEMLLQTLTRSAPVMLWMNDPDWKSTYFNQQWFEFTGTSPEDEAGWDWSRQVHVDDQPEVARAFQQGWDLREPCEMEFRLKHHSGEYRHVMARAVPHFAADGTFLGYIGSTLDIHDRKVAENLVRERELELREMVRREKQFVQNAAHEFRHPLAVMQGNLDMLIRHPNLPRTERMEIVSEAQQETLRLSRLINDMLMLARGDMGLEFRVEDVHLSEILRDVWNESRAVHPGHQFDWQVEPQVWMTGDPERLEQLVAELLENALKFTPTGGTITLAVKQSPQGVELRVSDTGMGIVESDLGRVFERFYRVDTARQRSGGMEGTGLGLPIARWIVEEHGGDIRLDSTVGMGTTVLVRFPVTPS